MGPTTIDGLPAHVLLVHIVVIAVPLSALALVVSLAWPAARRRLGVITPGLALVTLISVPLTTHAGKWLKRSTHSNPFLRVHAHLGDELIYWSASVFVIATLWWLQHNQRFLAQLAPLGEGVTAVATSRLARTLLAGLGLAAAIGSVVLVYRIGVSGARSVWQA